MNVHLSIIIPVYNDAIELKKCLDSVQTLKSEFPRNLEVIIVDGASTDNSICIAQMFEGLVTKIISEPDNGPYDAMNKGIIHASGIWIYFLGADDEIVLPGNILSAILKNETTSYYGDVILKSNGKRSGGRFSKLKLLRMNMPHQAIFYARKSISNIQYNLKYGILADWALNIRIFREESFTYFSNAVALYNNIDGISSINKDMSFQNDRLDLYGKHFGVTYAAVYKIIFELRKFYSLLNRR